LSNRSTPQSRLATSGVRRPKPTKTAGNHAMKHVPILSAILITALLAVAGTAYAQQPPDVVQSDSNWNTAMGTAALESVTPNSCYNNAHQLVAQR